MQITTLVTGGTGKTGSRVGQRLTDAGHAVRIGSRTGTPRFDWDDAATWPAALAGADQVYVAYQPDLAIPGTAQLMASFAAQAQQAGVRRLVLLSGRGEPEAQRCEEAIRDSGLETTIVRASWFAQNFTEGYLKEGVDAGVIALPATDVPEPFIDVDDIADIAAAALTSDDHVGETYDVTGPRLLTFAQVADALGVEHVALTNEQFSDQMRQAGVPGEVTDLLLFLFGEVLDGRNAHTTDGVQRALGRPPREVFAAAYLPE
jgi:uncharacterized protein YbjT (DUF2867 family)